MNSQFLGTFSSSSSQLCAHEGEGWESPSPPKQLVVQRGREAAEVGEPAKQSTSSLPSSLLRGLFGTGLSHDLANCLTGEPVSRLDSLQRDSSTEAPEGLQSSPASASVLLEGSPSKETERQALRRGGALPVIASCTKPSLPSCWDSEYTAGNNLSCYMPVYTAFFPSRKRKGASQGSTGREGRSGCCGKVVRRPEG